MKVSHMALLAVAIVGAYVVSSSVYTGSEVGQVIFNKFGKPVGDPVTPAGPKIKVP